MFRYLLLLLLAAAGAATSRAQFQGRVYAEDTMVSVVSGGRVLPAAWCGGMNNPQFAVADLNHDGRSDLVVFERNTTIVKTFINHGTPGAPVYRYAPRYAANFPAVSEYLILADYNCDSVPDLFQRGNGIDASNSGYSVYRGYYNARNELCFQYYNNLYYSNGTGNLSGVNNAYVNPSDIPSIADVDGDGDLDFVSYGIQGSLIDYYRNMRVEEGLPCDSIRIRLRDQCWGKVNQGFSRAHELGVYCDNSLLQRPSGTQKTQHTGNTLCLFDNDGDGDLDYLDGNISFPDMVFLRNGRTALRPHDSMVFQDTLWQTGGKMVNLPQWPSAFWVDADADGKKDLLISPHAEGSSENYKCAWLYRNTGTASAPSYQYQKDTFLIEDMIDLGTATYPMLYDYNKDGRPDLFVGSAGFYQSDGTLRSQISYYRNTSSGGNASFELVSRNFLDVFGQHIAGAAPATGDLNNDGFDDLLVGHADGTISYYRNRASSASVQPQWQLEQATLTDDAGAHVAANAESTPFIYDLNRDGKPDLLIGGRNGRIVYYENRGSAGTLSLHFVSGMLGNIQVQGFSGRTSPFIGRMDNTGRPYLITGSDGGTLYRYDGFQNGNLAASFTRIDTAYAQIFAGFRTAPAIGDIDNDGKYEMIVGNQSGGLNIYKQASPLGMSEAPKTQESVALQLYPNPASDRVHIGLHGAVLPAGALVQVYNSLGQLAGQAVVPAGAGEIEVELRGSVPGVYFVRLEDSATRYSGTFIRK